MNKKPDFFCIGMQKAGTTWLYENLKTHEFYFPCLIKEPHFYDNLYYWPKIHSAIFNEDFNILYSELAIKSDILNSIDWALKDVRNLIKSGRDITENLKWISSLIELKNNILSKVWYDKIFKNCQENQITGDFTADYYLLDKEGIEVIVKENPEAKFILFLRDPVDRDWSQIKMMSKTNSIDEFTDLINSPAFYGRNNYESIIENWINLVNPSNITIKFFEQISTNPEELLNSIVNFLEIPQINQWPNARVKFLEGDKKSLPVGIKKILIKRNADSIYYLSQKFAEFHHLVEKYKL